MWAVGRAACWPTAACCLAAYCWQEGRQAAALFCTLLAHLTICLQPKGHQQGGASCGLPSAIVAAAELTTLFCSPPPPLLCSHKGTSKERCAQARTGLLTFTAQVGCSQPVCSAGLFARLAGGQPTVGCDRLTGALPLAAASEQPGRPARFDQPKSPCVAQPLPLPHA